jgi:hypothetical protein
VRFRRLRLLAGCGKSPFDPGLLPSAAKAGLIFRHLAARLEAVPFQIKRAQAFFRNLFRDAASVRYTE